MEEIEKQKDADYAGGLETEQSSIRSPGHKGHLMGSSESSFESSQQQSDDSWKTSSNYFDSDDEDNPLNRLAREHE